MTLCIWICDVNWSECRCGPGYGQFSGVYYQFVLSFPFTSIPKSFCCRSLIRSSLSLYRYQGIALTQVQHFALGFTEFQDLFMLPLVTPVHVPLHGIPSLMHVKSTAQLGVICKPAQGALGSHCVIGEDIKQFQSQYRPLRDSITVSIWTLRH
ncbi:hypothetical protein TURU_106451 [Turdus rufiventris]|nr:hypothetical protein TURU_106451 [Turdus rufiventris]